MPQPLPSPTVVAGTLPEEERARQQTQASGAQTATEYACSMGCQKEVGGCGTIHMGAWLFDFGSRSPGCTSAGALHGLKCFPPLMLTAWIRK